MEQNSFSHDRNHIKRLLAEAVSTAGNVVRLAAEAGFSKATVYEWIWGTKKPCATSVVKLEHYLECKRSQNGI